jgi:GNAT superfamily N-acetyltransferase
MADYSLLYSHCNIDHINNQGPVFYSTSLEQHFTISIFQIVPDHKKLDNPAWFALNEKHARFAMGTTELKRYDPEVVLFAGFHSYNKNIRDQLDDVINVNESFFFFEPFAALPGNYIIETIVECLQMICHKPAPVTITENIIVLNEKNTAEMFSLVSKVFPGYYLPQTRQLGHYAGIFKEGQLVAMAGERLCMDGYTEISAVVTHPAHTGKSYAQQLVAYLTGKNLQQGNIPFLHTGYSNERAINIYELLGFEKRRIINVTKIKRTA